MRLLLALAIGRLLNRASSLCIWNAIAGKVEQTFARQAYSMTWFFAEANPFAGASGSFSGQVKYLAEAVEALPGGSGRVTWGPAQSLDLPTSFVVSTDPPYYDAVPYADLSDFFLVWLREMVGSTLPSTFNTVLAPKSEELVADHVRHGGRRQAADFFEDGLSKVFSRLADSHSKSYPMTVYYAFKAVETSTDGQDSTGWETFLQSLITAGWAIVGTWPLRTERSGGLRALGRNALASSVVVSCRLRAGTAEAISRRGLITALKQELPTALRELEQGSIAPVDLAQAAIGPGMAVFSRYARVVEADGSDMTVRTALALINQVLDEVLSEQEGDFDADTRFCLTWFSEYGWNEAEYGRADDLARSRNTSVDGLVRGGVFWARGGKARLVPPEDLGRVWDPSADERVSVWEAAVRLAQTLQSRGIEAAAEVMAGAGHRVDLDAVKELAYLLFAVSEKKNRTETALLFNQLASSWPDLSAAARSAGSASGGSAQGVLSFEGGE
jgi:putative DNA methylase